VIKNIFFTVFFVSSIAPFAFGLDSKNLDGHVSVSVQPFANWLYVAGNYLDYNLDPSVFTTVEFSLEYKKYLKFLFDFDINANDNLVGKIADSKALARIAGTLGIKNFALRAAWGQIEGEAVWNGLPIPGQPQSVAVSTKYTEVALLYYGSLGIIYQNYHLPMELAYGYDDDMVIDYYGAWFGVSTMDFFMEERKNGIGFWLGSSGSLGVAFGKASEEGERRRAIGAVIEDDRNGNVSEIMLRGDSSAAFSGSAQLVLGIYGGVNAGKLFMGFGVGYDGFLQSYWCVDYQSTLIRHGVTVKVDCSF
jgi:hypothetical protein